MSAFRLTDLRCTFGIDCGGLSPGADRLERSVEFKRAVEADFQRHFDLYLPNRSFESPYRAPQIPRVVLQPDTFGDLDRAQVLDLAQAVLETHVRGGVTVKAMEASRSVCVRTPTGWKEIGGYFIELDGHRYDATGAVQEFEARYRANRNAVPAGFDVDLQELRGLPVLFWVVREI